MQTQQLLTGEGAQHFRLLPQFAGVGPQSGTSQHIAAVRRRFRHNQHIIRLGVDRHRLIGRQRPRCRGPDQQMGAVEFGSRCGDAKPDGHRRILPALIDVIVHPKFMAGQRCLVIPAIRQHTHAFIGEALVPQLFERPDHRLHERQVESLVVIVEIHPAGLAGHIRPPLSRVFQN